MIWGIKQNNVVFPIHIGKNVGFTGMTIGCAVTSKVVFGILDGGGVDIDRRDGFCAIEVRKKRNQAGPTSNLQKILASDIGQILDIDNGLSLSRTVAGESVHRSGRHPVLLRVAWEKSAKKPRLDVVLGEVCWLVFTACRDFRNMLRRLSAAQKEP